MSTVEVLDAEIVERTNEQWADAVRSEWQTEQPTLAQIETFVQCGRGRAIKIRNLAFGPSDRTTTVRTKAVRTTRTEVVEMVRSEEESALSDRTTDRTIKRTKTDRTTPDYRTPPIVTSAYMQSGPAVRPVTDRTDRVESVVRTLILITVGLMAGAASFTHMHDWTMQMSPARTPDWIGWTNAIISELGPLGFGLAVRSRRRTGQSVWFPGTMMFAFAALSLAAQVSQAKPGPSGWLLAAVPALAFMALLKLTLSRTPVRAAH